MIRTSDFMGYAAEGMRVRNLNGRDLYNTVKNMLKREIEARGIPAAFYEDEVSSGGFFGSKIPALVVYYKDPPSSFFDIVVVINNNVITFPLIGESTENTKMNQKARLEAEGKRIRAAMINPDEFLLQQEYAWRAEIMDLFENNQW